MDELKFEWDENKNLLNQKKHGVDFETAAFVFNDEYHVEMYDARHSIDEDRYIAIGRVGNMLYVIFTRRREKIRLISARLATKREVEVYYDQNLCS